MVPQAVSPPPERVPQHIVLIPDGNGRWAREHHRPVPEGHLQGARAVEGFLRVCRDWGIPVATVWAFSTENWGRSAAEVEAIMRLVGIYLRRNRPTVQAGGDALSPSGPPRSPDRESPGARAAPGQAGGGDPELHAAHAQSGARLRRSRRDRCARCGG